MTWKKRLSKFGKEPDTETAISIQDCMRKSRIVVLEFKLVDAIKLAARDPEEGKKAINLQLAPAVLTLSGINRVKDVRKTIWGSVAQVLENKKVALE